MTTYRAAPAVTKIAERLIDTIPTHQPLAAAGEIRCLFRDPPAKSKGNIVLGKARKISGLNAALLDNHLNEDPVDPDPVLVIEIAEEPWADMTTTQREALVDHELCHFTVEVDDNGNVKLGVRGHDLEEFTQIVERHGLWRPDVAIFVHTANQGRLNLDPDDD